MSPAYPVFYSEGPKLYATAPEGKAARTRCSLEYLNEGGANIVFRILPSDAHTPLPDSLQGKLLRLRKNLSHVQSAQEQLASFQTNFLPLFPAANLIQLDPIALDSSLLAGLNTHLTSLPRPLNRQTDFLPETETLGILVTDMTPSPDELLIELKPKWLAQSPNAPPGAVRCRTCALRACRAAGGKNPTATDAQAHCALDLVSADVEDRRRAAEGITTDAAARREFLGDGSGDVRSLLLRLKELQERLDPVGVLEVRDEERGVLDLCRAMTLRDCTLFVRGNGEWFEARLADLDLKVPGKLEAWREVERELGRGGWYLNCEEKAVWREEEVCLLARKRNASVR